MTIVPHGRKLLRLEVRNADTPIERKPGIKTRATMGPRYGELQQLVKSDGLNTVCRREHHRPVHRMFHRDTYLDGIW